MTLLFIVLHPSCYERETVTIAFEKASTPLQLTAVSAATQKRPHCFIGKKVLVVVSAHKSLLSDSGNHEPEEVFESKRILSKKSTLCQ